MSPILTPNQQEPFRTNVLNTELWRTGTAKDGSCFFHSLYMPFKYYRSLSPEKRIEFIAEKRRECADKMNMESWFSIQGGNIAFLQIIETMRELIYTIPKILQETQGMAMEILFHLLDPSFIENNILPQWDMECSRDEKSAHFFLDNIKQNWYHIYRKRIDASINEIENRLPSEVERMSEEKKNRVIEKLSLLSFPIFDFVSSKALENFRKEIAQMDKWINIFIYTVIIEMMDLPVNVIFIDYETGMPYEGMKLLYNKKRYEAVDKPFAVLLYFKDLHFESLGKKQVVGGKTIINRLFSKLDPFIITCLTYLEKDLEDEDRSEEEDEEDSEEEEEEDDEESTEEEENEE